MSWVNAYVGIPFADQGRDASGCDCWGLVRLVFAAERGINLPSYAGAYLCALESREVAELLAAGRAAGSWQSVRTPAAFDVALIRKGRLACHVALAIGGRQLLHMDAGDQSKIVSADCPRFARRIVGFYRHVNAPSKGVL